MAVKNALRHSRTVVASLDVRVQFRAGRNKAKELGTSPDALVQMGLILGYYRLNNGELPATYETAHTRQFYHGRTETIRSCSMSVKTMCKAMQDPKFSSIEKESFIRDAISAHNKYTVECMNGQGIDRHLLCLQLLAAEMDFENMPSFFRPFTKCPSTCQHPIFWRRFQRRNNGGYNLQQPMVMDAATPLPNI